MQSSGKIIFCDSVGKGGISVSIGETEVAIGAIVTSVEVGDGTMPVSVGASVDEVGEP
ncbi:hypothetical protein C5S53_01145 [Methanophagales archaeon]|nr:hypothetical protein C5S53_01145 [Methanophagales archaeon]